MPEKPGDQTIRVCVVARAECEACAVPDGTEITINAGGSIGLCRPHANSLCAQLDEAEREQDN